MTVTETPEQSKPKQADSARARKARRRVAVVPLTDEAQKIVVAAVRAGNYLDTAGAAAGWSKETTYQLLRDGRRLSNLRAQKVRLSPTERKVADFSDAVTTALAESEAADVAMLERLGMGQDIVKTTIEERRNRNGEIIESRSKMEELPPNPDVLMWRLERRFPKKYGRRSAVELSGRDGGPIPFEQRTQRLSERLAALQAGDMPALLSGDADPLDETDRELLGD